MKPAVKGSIRDRKSFELPPSKVRSAITNGRRLFIDIDGRSAWHRRYRDLLQLHLNDLGGADQTSEFERSIVRRAVTLTTQLECLETKFAANDGEATPQQLEVYQRCANTLRRLLESLGLQRRPRDVTPSLREYLGREASL